MVTSNKEKFKRKLTNILKTRTSNKTESLKKLENKMKQIIHKKLVITVMMSLMVRKTIHNYSNVEFVK